MDLTTRQLEQFVVVAQEEHLGRAARRLHISQPPLTQAVQRLERLLDVALLHREGRSVRLTPAGRSFAEDAEALLAAQQAAVDRARRVAAGLAGTVRIGSVGTLAFGYVPAVLRLAATQLPAVRLEVQQGPSTALLAAVHRRELDIAVVHESSARGDGLVVRPVLDEALRLAVPAAHRLAGRRRVRLAELRDETFVAYVAGGAEDHDTLREACAAAGFAPTVAAEAADLPGLLAWVAAGRALALVPAQAATIAGPDVQVMDVVGGGHALRARFAAVALPARDQAVARVLDVMAAA